MADDRVGTLETHISVLFFVGDHEGGDASDADAAVAAAMAARMDPWPQALTVSTHVPSSACVERALDLVGPF